MSQAGTLVSTPLTNAARVAGAIVAKMALTAESYTNGAALVLDFTNAITQAMADKRFNWSDLAAVIATSDKGHSVSATPDAAAYKVDVRLFNGTTELTTGNVTANITCVLLFF